MAEEPGRSALVTAEFEEAERHFIRVVEESESEGSSLRLLEGLEGLGTVFREEGRYLAALSLY